MAKKAIIPVFIPHAGCPHDCVFCNQRSISGHAAPPDPEEVVRTVETALLKTGPGAELAFYGGSFTAIPATDQERYLLSARPFILDGRLGGIRVSTRPDAIDEETLDRLEKYGVGTVELGAQSMDDFVLLKSARGHTSADTAKASRLIKARGFALVLQMMVGLPCDSPEKDMETCEKLCALSPDAVRIYPVVVLKGTGLYDLWMRGEYEALSVEKAVDICAKLLPVFESAGIRVIRLGLNPSDDLSGGEAVAGAYHPAFGELVRSAVYLARASKLLESADARGKTAVFSVPEKRLSAFIGRGRSNLAALKEKFGLAGIRAVPDEAFRGDGIGLKFIR